MRFEGGMFSQDFTEDGLVQSHLPRRHDDRVDRDCLPEVVAEDVEDLKVKKMQLICANRRIILSGE